MANTGYIIHPKVIQKFTSGPDSGTQVNSLFTASFDVSSSFTSSYLCEVQYVYKELDYINCPIPGFCPSPTIISINNNNCVTYDYIYNFSYNINSPILNTPSSSIEYCLNNSFTGETGSQNLLNIDIINSSSLNISDLIDLPLNQFTPIYFRMKNNCSGSGDSSYSEIISSSCMNEEPESPTLYRVILSRNDTEFFACNTNITSFCDENGHCGNFYWSDNTDFNLNNVLYNQNNTSFPSPIGWYSNGIISKYWNGSQFTNQITCS